MAKKRYTYSEQFDAVSDAIEQFHGLMEAADDEYCRETQKTVDVLYHIAGQLRRKRDKPTKAQLRYARKLAQELRDKKKKEV